MENTTMPNLDRKTNLTWLWVLLVIFFIVGICFAVWYFFIRKPVPKDDKKTTDDKTKKQIVQNTSTTDNAQFPLVQGQSGALIKQLQTALVAKGANVGASGIDGQFGQATAAALTKLGLSTTVTKDIFDNLQSANGSNTQQTNTNTNTNTNSNTTFNNASIVDKVVGNALEILPYASPIYMAGEVLSGAGSLIAGNKPSWWFE